MYKLEIDGKFITLPNNFASTIRETNLYLSLKIVGDYAYQFTIPADDISRSIFGNIMFPYIAGSSEQSYPARLWCGSYLLFEGFANLRKASMTTYSIDLTKNPGNVKKSLYETSLRKLDLGSHTFETTVVKTGLWTIPYSAAPTDTNYQRSDMEHNLGNNLFDLRTTVDITVDTKKVVNLTFTPQGRSLSSRNYFQTVWQDALKAVSQDSNVGVIIVDDGQSISIEMPDNLQYNIKITIQDIFGMYSSYTAKQVSYDAIIQDKLIPELNPVFCYPPVRNTSAYEDGDWKGIINAYTDKKVLQVNDYQNRTSYAISPAFKVIEILRNVLKILGFEMQADFEDHPDLKDILIISTKNQDKQCPGLLLAFNVFDPELKFADYMPDITIKEFLENCKILYGFGLDFDLSESIVYVSSIKTKLEQTKAIDISDLVSYAVQNNAYQRKNYQIKYSSQPEYDKYLPYPTDADLEDSYLDTELIELKLIPAMLYSEIQKLEDISYQLSSTQQDYIYFDSVVQSPLFAQKDNIIEYRIFYAKGWKDGVLGLSTIGTEVDLQITGDKGLYAWNSSLFNFLQNAEEFEATLNFNPYTASGLNISDMYHAYHVHFFITEIEKKIPFKENSTFRFLRLGN